MRVGQRLPQRFVDATNLLFRKRPHFHTGARLERGGKTLGSRRDREKDLVPGSESVNRCTTNPLLHLSSMQLKTTQCFAAQVAAIFLLFAFPVCAFAIARPGVEYKIFQFPADKIPRFDGAPSDWSTVPEDYSIGIDQLK